MGELQRIVFLQAALQKCVILTLACKYNCNDLCFFRRRRQNKDAFLLVKDDAVQALKDSQKKHSDLDLVSRCWRIGYQNHVHRAVRLRRKNAKRRQFDTAVAGLKKVHVPGQLLHLEFRDGYVKVCYSKVELVLVDDLSALLGVKQSWMLATSILGLRIFTTKFQGHRMQR